MPQADRPRRKKEKLPAWTHPAVYAGVRTAAATVQAAGLEPSSRVLRRLGGWYGGLPANRKRLARAEDNIAWCFPDWPQDRVHDTALEAYRHLFTLAAEVSAAPRFLSLDGVPNIVELGPVAPALDTLLQPGPVILVTAHCGNWELLGAALAALGFPVHALYRPLDMKPLDAWMHRTRAARGITLVDKFGATQQLPELMTAGTPIGFIADQNAGDNGLFVPFFGRLASAYKSIAVLAQQYEAPIICGRATRLRDDPADPSSQRFRYRVQIDDIIAPACWQQQPDATFYITARYRRAIEHMVRAAPEQYLWMHRYWKSRPRHERQDKPFPPKLRDKIAALPWMTDDDLLRLIDRSDRDRRERHPTG